MFICIAFSEFDLLNIIILILIPISITIIIFISIITSILIAIIINSTKDDFWDMVDFLQNFS